MERIENERPNNYFIGAREFVAVGNVFIKNLPSNDGGIFSVPLSSKNSRKHTDGD
jgi:hypothetical protein